MLNKLQFNNLVLSTKKEIHKGRVQIINKLVNKIKKLKGYLKKKFVHKINERLKRAEECFHEIKKIKEIDIMKNVITFEKDPKCILTNNLASSKDLAISLLATNKIIKNLVIHFKNELHLNEAVDKEWIADLLKPSKRCFKIQQVEVKRQKRKDIKQQKAVARKRLEWLEENKSDNLGEGIDNPESIHNVNINETDTKPNGWCIEPLEMLLNEEKPLETVSTAKKLDDNNAASHVMVTNKIKETKLQKKPKDFKKPQQKEKLKEEILEILPHDVEENDISVETATNITHVADPFFITETGENYLSTAIITPAVVEPKENHRTNKNFELKRQRNHTAKTFTSRREYPRREEYQENNNLSQIANDTNAQNLHPSWVAKQKQKPIIAKFKGKKIKFNNDNNTNKRITTINGINAAAATTEIPFKPKPTKQVHNTKDTSSITLKKEEVQLHPSWAAKQKQKPIVKPFEGKKITFDNV